MMYNEAAFGAFAHNGDREKFLQTSFLRDIVVSLDSINGAMANVRQNTADAMAIQHEMLQREQVQGYIEELVFQTEKLVASCSAADSDIPPSSKFFLLSEVLQRIDSEGIGTPIIRGRDNKAAFERVVGEAHRLRKELESHPEVVEALAWARKQEVQREAKQNELERRISLHRGEVEALQLRKNPMAFQEAASAYFVWQKNRIPQSLHIPIMVAFGIGCLMILPIPIFVIAILVDVHKYREKENQAPNARLDEEISAICGQIAKLQGELNAI
ncbi:MAG: hypothetical protein K1X57_00800 [Gemmataceae bacterium]|nr:hypothetical protein [Gemmataceae bacterium]